MHNCRAFDEEAGTTAPGSSGRRRCGGGGTGRVGAVQAMGVWPRLSTEALGGPPECSVEQSEVPSGPL